MSETQAARQTMKPQPRHSVQRWSSGEVTEGDFSERGGCVLTSLFMCDPFDCPNTRYLCDEEDRFGDLPGTALPIHGPLFLQPVCTRGSVCACAVSCALAPHQPVLKMVTISSCRTTAIPKGRQGPGRNIPLTRSPPVTFAALALTRKHTKYAESGDRTRDFSDCMTY